MSKVQTGPLAGLVVQILLLAGLAATVGLGPAGWLVGLGYGVASCALLVRGLVRAGSSGPGPADWVTMGRGILVGGVAALTAESFSRPVPVALLVGLAAVALALDAVDGQVARRTGTASPLGARLDMEVDAVLLLVLSSYAAPSLGLWVLAIGGMRYAFVAAMGPFRWLSGPLPPRYWRKVVAATQGVVLVVAAADVLPRSVMVGVLVAALALLVESFGRDVRWRWRHRHDDAAARPVRPAPHRTAPRWLGDVGIGNTRITSARITSAQITGARIGGARVDGVGVDPARLDQPRITHSPATGFAR